MTAADLLQTCRKLGLSLQPRGEGLAVRPANRATPELLAQIRAHKPALLTLLEAQAANLPADCSPWLHVARQILAGEFGGADRSTIASLTIGLRGVNHPLCRRALNHLQPTFRR